MGMKSNGGHFGSNTGGPSKRQGETAFKLNLQLFAQMPKPRAQIMHILANRPNHLPDTPENRKLFEEISNDKHNYVRSDPRGFDVYSKVVGDKEIWVYERDGIIQDAGYNTEFRYHKKEAKEK